MTDFRKITSCSAKLRRLFPHRDPDRMCHEFDIQVAEMDLGTEPGCIKGLIQKNFRCHTIIVNENLPDSLKRIVKYHELMHYRLGHLSVPTCTFHDNSFSYQPDTTLLMRLENEANLCLADFLLDTEECLDLLHHMPASQAAAALGVPPEILTLKCMVMQNEGCLEKSTSGRLELRSDFMARFQTE